jgi:hypothetical protein
VHNYASSHIKVISGILDYDVLPEEIPVLLGNLENPVLYTSQNSFRFFPKTILPEYNCNQDLVFEKTQNQIGFSIAL